ncbi:ABC transporter permease [Vallitalea sp.]|jgi:ABC-type dipeptide/oligopeptide/nickel transport system permease subunit|uniref:ABC transporter permease n=1 Tax=Vallitalea sp. TaxID=1882829 RepID=UPI0025E683E1|nr:ABC transporter permease [Vallitalea sp.]MCT4685871.1 ABC transporter permease [Vallitalea sp.]
MAVSKDKFKLVNHDLSNIDNITTESTSFWKDARRRLKNNKASMIGFYAILFLIVMSIIGPISPINQKNANGTVFKYDHAPVLNDENGTEIPKKDIAFLPPRVPGLEKLGIFDGHADIEIGTFDLIIGKLPKTDEFDELKKPFKRKDLIEKIQIPYHPFDINIIEIYENDSNIWMAKIKVKATEEIKELPYEELISEYSKFRPGTFVLKKSEIDEYGVEMVSLNADFYAIQNIKERYFWFGTDRLALDNWTRLWIGVRVSLIIALASLIIDFSIGIIYGTIAGFYGGTRVDTIMMRITEILGSIPTLVLMIIFLSISKTIGSFIDGILPGHQGLPTIRLIILILAMSLTGWIGVSRVVRAQILKLREREFVLASRTLGASKKRLMTKHLFPNIIGQIIVMATFSIPGAIFHEAFLTFIGIGLPIPMASLGVLVKDGYDAIQTIPSMLWIPAIIMSILMLSINLLANGLRDALDPRMR